MHASYARATPACARQMSRTLRCGALRPSSAQCDRGGGGSGAAGGSGGGGGAQRGRRNTSTESGERNRSVAATKRRRARLRTATTTATPTPTDIEDSRTLLVALVVDFVPKPSAGPVKRRHCKLIKAGGSISGISKPTGRARRAIFPACSSIFPIFTARDLCAVPRERECEGVWCPS